MSGKTATGYVVYSQDLEIQDHLISPNMLSVHFNPSNPWWLKKSNQNTCILKRLQQKMC